MSATTGERPPAEGANHNSRQRLAWYTYDWANSVFTNSLTSVFFGPFLTDVVRQAAGPDGYVELVGIPVRAESYWPFLTGVSVFLLLFAQPAAGLLARRVPRHALLGSFALLGAACTIALVTLSPGTYLFGSLLYLAAQVCLACSVVVYDTYLPEIAAPRVRERTSTTGAAAGYLGGAIVLAISLAVTGLHDSFGLAEDQATAVCIALAGVWWAAFSIFPIRTLPRTPLNATLPGVATSAQGLRAALRDLRGNRTIALFLLAFLFFNASYQTVNTQSSTFASEELGIPDSGMVVGVLLVNVIAVAGAMLAGRLAERVGAVRVLIGMLGVWVLMTALSQVIPGGSLPAFLILAVVIGSVHGGTYALSRGIFANLIPRRLTGEYFGLFEIVNRCFGAAGSLAFGLVLQVSADYRLAMASLAIWFVLGGILLWCSGAGRVRAAKEVAQ